MVKKNIKPNSYNDQKEELDDILVKLQDVKIDIDEAIKYYQRGIEIIKSMEKYLHTAENKIRQIKNNIE